ncbi:MAG: GNAT family N-acetyltransferase [Armatimonadetes bacterium]|nr:GNAT family N-acetyltransferase [Armatimonadota bacterium]
MKLRIANPEDASQIANLYLDIRKDTVPIIHTLTEAENWIRDQRIARGSSWVLELDDQVIGWLDVHGDDLDQLYLKRGFQGLGYGKKLVDHAKELSPSRLELFTFQVNDGARRFYAREGFREVYWGDGSDNEEGQPDVKLVWESGQR